MAGDEDQPQQVVADVVVEQGRAFGQRDILPDLELAPDRLVLAAQAAPAGAGGRSPGAADGHEPGARVVRDARLGPLLEGRDEGVLGELLGQADVARRRGPGRR